MLFITPRNITNMNPKVKRLQKFVTYSSSIRDDDIKEKSIKMISNGKKTKVDLYARDNEDVRKKSMNFENNKTNLAKLLKVDPVFEDLDTRLYKDFLQQSKSKSKSKSRKKSKSKSKSYPKTITYKKLKPKSKSRKKSKSTSTLRPKQNSKSNSKSNSKTTSKYRKSRTMKSK